MLLSKGKIITAYYYIALIAFALSACAVMFEQESSGGIAYCYFVMAFAFMVWSVFVLRPFTKDYLIEIPSKTIIFFNFYMTWVLLVTAINPVGVKGISSYLNSLFWSAMNSTFLVSSGAMAVSGNDASGKEALLCREQGFQGCRSSLWQWQLSYAGAAAKGG